MVRLRGVVRTGGELVLSSRILFRSLLILGMRKLNRETAPARERCDQSKNYFCLSTARNPLRDIGGAALNATYDSLRDDDNTELDSLSFDPSTLVASATHASETTPSLVPAITTMASSRDGGSDTPAPQPPSNGDSGGVSAGTIAGAAVGAGIAVVLLALGFWLIRWRRRRRRRTGGGPQQSQLPPPRPPQGTYSSSAGTEIYHDRQQGSSLTNPSELHGTDQSVGELPAVIPQEMPANWR